MKQLKFLYLLAATTLFISCEKNEPISKFSKADIVFDKTYDDINSVPQRIVVNSNNDFFLYGWDYILKVDENGDKKWSIKNSNNDLVPTKDGGCIIAYTKYGSNSYERTFYLTKISSTGNIEWEKSGPNYQLSQIIVGDSDEIYGVGDVEISYNNTKPKFFKYSKEGDYLFSKLLINTDDIISYQTNCMVMLRNNKFVIGTMKNSSIERENYDFNIIEFDVDASTISEKHYGGYKNENLMSISETPDDGLILTGCSQSKDGDIKSYRNELSLDGTNGWVVKLGKNRVIEWEKIMGGTSSSTYFYKAVYLNNKYLVGFNTEATDVDFKGVERPKSGYIILNEAGNILDVKYIGAWSVDCEFSSKGELQILSSHGDQYYNIYNPRLIKIKTISL